MTLCRLCFSSSHQLFDRRKTRGNRRVKCGRLGSLEPDVASLVKSRWSGTLFTENLTGQKVYVLQGKGDLLCRERQEHGCPQTPPVHVASWYYVWSRGNCENTEPLARNSLPIVPVTGPLCEQAGQY